MKKKETKKKIKKENGIEVFARMVARGFEKMREEFRRGQEELRQEFRHGLEELRQEVAGVKDELSGVKDEVFSLKEDQKEIKRAVQSLEKKQSGTLLSLDETVHRNEFKKLERRVEALEA